MTNFEKYMGDLIKLLIENPDEILSNAIGVSDGTPYLCKDIPCGFCEFHDSWVSCADKVMDWLHEEVDRECTITEKYVNDDDRPDWCPLVDVPDEAGNCSEIPNNSDSVSRQAAIDALRLIPYDLGKKELEDAIKAVEQLPSAQPERTCVNCGRTVRNGGWYEDGGTRCPIEEHYALPKDGFCHLWEKRNVTDDDYPERRTDEE